jgi:purine-binding chemotaxis protein CheW
METEEATLKLLIFRLSGFDCAFPLDAVREIAPMASLFRPPGLPPALAGFLDLRGTAIPILHLDRLLGLPDQLPGLHTPMVVLHGLPESVGILVDYVRCIAPVTPLQLMNIPVDRTFRGCATNALQFDGDLIHLLSPTALLAADEVRVLADYCDMSQARLIQLEATN